MEVLDIDDDACVVSNVGASMQEMRKRRRSEISSSSFAAYQDGNELSAPLISLSDNNSKRSEIITAYGTYVKTGAYILPDSYEEVMSSKINENTSSSSELRPRAVKIARTSTHGQDPSSMWAKVLWKQKMR